MNPWALLRPEKASEYKEFDTIDGVQSNVAFYNMPCLEVYRQSIQDGDEPSSVKI